MSRARLVDLATLAIAGCAPLEPPPHVVYDRDMTAMQRSVAETAVSAWCDAVGYCPDPAAWAERGRIDARDIALDGGDMSRCPAGAVCERPAHNDGDNISFSPKSITAQDPDRFWRALAHEIGHYCTGHTHTGLMAPVHTPGEPLEIDDVAIRAWNRGCGW